MGELLRAANKFSVVFELIPIALAILVLFMALRPIPPRIRGERRNTLYLAYLCAVLLIFAQSSWWISYVWHGSLSDTVFANLVWTIFNSLVMVVLFRVVHAEVSHG